MNYNIAKDCVDRHASGPHRDKVALYALRRERGQLIGQTCTFKDIFECSNFFAQTLLDQGFKAGDRLIIRLPNGPEFVISFIGAIKAGLIPIPSSYQFTSHEFRHYLQDSEAAVVATMQSVFPKAFIRDIPSHLKSVFYLDPVKPEGTLNPPYLWMDIVNAGLSEFSYPETDGEAPAYWLYTSGTQGPPKCVIHAHRSIPAHDERVKVWQNLQETDVVFNTSALNWSYALNSGLLDLWRQGVSVVTYHGELRPEIIREIIRDLGVTVFMSVPGIYRRLSRTSVQEMSVSPVAEVEMTQQTNPHSAVADGVQQVVEESVDEVVSPEPEDSVHGFGKVRVCLSAGEGLPDSIREQFRQRTGQEIYEGLGMTEHSIYIVQPYGEKIVPSSCGRPLPNTRVALIDKEGREVAEGKNGIIVSHKSCAGLMLGYREEVKGAFREEWFLSGDLARADSAGNYYYAGRNDDLITAGGYRLSPQEIEAVINLHPLVEESAVVDREFENDKMLLCAYVVRRPGKQTMDELREDLRQHLKEHLAGHKMPKMIRFLKELPKSASGKIQRKFLSRRKKKELTFDKDGKPILEDDED